MALANTSFETAGAAPGTASAWTVSSYSARDSMSFDDEPAEDFEELWASNEAFVSAFEPASLAVHQIATITVLPFEEVESFETLWSSNQSYVYGLAPITASFDVATAEDWEDFEEEWDSNEDFLSAFVGPGTDLTALSCDVGAPEPVENFEEEWSSNENFLSAFVGPGTDLTLVTLAGGETEENFEGAFDAWPSITL